MACLHFYAESLKKEDQNKLGCLRFYSSETIRAYNVKLWDIVVNYIYIVYLFLVEKASLNYIPAFYWYIVQNFFSVWDILRCTWFLHECRYSIFLKNCNEFLKLWTHYFKFTRFNVTHKKNQAHLMFSLFAHKKNRFFLTKDWLLCNSKNFCQERVVNMVYPIIQDENKALYKNFIPSCSKNLLIRTFCNIRSLVLNKKVSWILYNEIRCEELPLLWKLKWQFWPNWT